MAVSEDQAGEPRAFQNRAQARTSRPSGLQNHTTRAGFEPTRHKRGLRGAHRPMWYLEPKWLRCQQRRARGLCQGCAPAALTERLQCTGLLRWDRRKRAATALGSSSSGWLVKALDRPKQALGAAHSRCPAVCGWVCGKRRNPPENFLIRTKKIKLTSVAQTRRRRVGLRAKIWRLKERKKRPA